MDAVIHDQAQGRLIVNTEADAALNPLDCANACLRGQPPYPPSPHSVSSTCTCQPARPGVGAFVTHPVADRRCKGFQSQRNTGPRCQLIDNRLEFDENWGHSYTLLPRSRSHPRTCRILRETIEHIRCLRGRSPAPDEGEWHYQCRVSTIYVVGLKGSQNYEQSTGASRGTHHCAHLLHSSSIFITIS